MSETFKMTFLTGKVYIPEPTGRIIIDRDGWAYPEYTDRVSVDGDGREISRTPHKPVVKMQDDDTIAIARRFCGR